MKHLFEPTSVAEILKRIELLAPNAQRQWGKMDVAQMMAHCSETLEMAVGEKHPPRLFIGRILGPFAKPSFISDQPFRKKVPTSKNLVIAGERDFNREKSRLLNLIKKFHEGGETKVTRHPHNFFGKLSPREWAIGMYKHLDHHLRQFNA